MTERMIEGIQERLFEFNESKRTETRRKKRCRLEVLASYCEGLEDASPNDLQLIPVTDWDNTIHIAVNEKTDSPDAYNICRIYENEVVYNDKPLYDDLTYNDTI